MRVSDGGGLAYPQSYPLKMWALLMTDNRTRTAFTSVRENLLLSIIVAAGWPVWPLLLCSVLAVALSLERWMQLRTSRVVPVGLLDSSISTSQQQWPTREQIDQLARQLIDLLTGGPLLLTGADAAVQQTDRDHTGCAKLHPPLQAERHGQH